MQVLHNQKPTFNWYLVYTIPKSEKKAYLKLQQMGITCFLPMHTVVRQWSDRKKKLEVPLFPNYIFVYTTLSRRFEILQIKELMHFVCFGGEFATVSDSIVTALRRILDTNLEISNEYMEGPLPTRSIAYEQGTKVRILHGHLAGTEGIMIQKNGKNRLVLQIEALRQAVSVEVFANQVECCVA